MTETPEITQKFIMTETVRELNTYTKYLLSTLKSEFRITKLNTEDFEPSIDVQKQKIKDLFLLKISELPLTDVFPESMSDTDKLIKAISITNIKVELKHHKLPNVALLRLQIEIPLLTENEVEDILNKMAQTIMTK